MNASLTIQPAGSPPGKPFAPSRPGRFIRPRTAPNAAGLPGGGTS